MMNFSKTLVILLIAFLGISSLHAQDGPPYKWSFGLGLGFRDFTGIPNQNLDSVSFEPAARIQFSRYLGPSFDAMLEAAIPVTGIRQPRDPEGLTDLDLHLRYKFNNGYILQESSLFAPFVYTGVSTSIVDWQNPNPQVAVPFGLGVRIQTKSPVTIDLHTNYKLSVTDYVDYFTANVGFTFLFGMPKEEEIPPTEPDADGDGVADIYDECPNSFGLAEYNGCPDRDGDGVIDNMDNCPDEAGSLVNQGCPDQDADKDGIPDEEDDCPNSAGLANLNGCPDRDNDNTPDHLDDCPDTPGSSLSNGCPDSDGDGVSDQDDLCPEEAGIPALKGCPEIEEEDQEQLAFATEMVQFRSNSDLLLDTSYPILDTLANILMKYPSYKLRASGHTDSQGEADFNQDLSEKRAKACVAYLQSIGIPVSRLVYIGYGETQPISDNINETGRAENRRVIFELFLP